MGVNLLSVEEVKEIIKKDNIPSILKTTYVKDCLKKAEDHTGRKYS